MANYVANNRHAKPHPTDLCSETADGDKILSPILLEGRAEADDIRRGSAYSQKRSMFARNEHKNFRDDYYIESERRKFEFAPGTSGGHKKKEVD